MTTFTVLVTAHNNAAVVGKTLQSVESALVRARDGGTAPDGAGQVVVVDDGSVDDTVRVVEEFIRGRPAYELLQRASKSSASGARNAGARQARGELLFFLDGDDLFLPDHIHECVRLLADPGLDFVKSSAVMADPVHPYWKSAVENSIVINVCIRRRVHELAGGFPDYHLFVRRGAAFLHQTDLCTKMEDMLYNRILREVFRGFRLPRETVEYVRYPGNSYDRQYEKFSRPPDGKPPTEDEDFMFRYRLSEMIVEHHIRGLKRQLSSA
jgi:glycosyltransferase involved in cell wall biosynthesis